MIKVALTVLAMLFLVSCSSTPQRFPQSASDKSEDPIEKYNDIVKDPAKINETVVMLSNACESSLTSLSSAKSDDDKGKAIVEVLKNVNQGYYFIAALEIEQFHSQKTNNDAISQVERHSADCFSKLKKEIPEILRSNNDHN
jgi:hypothetical protein